MKPVHTGNFLLVGAAVVVFDRGDSVVIPSRTASSLCVSSEITPEIVKERITNIAKEIATLELRIVVFENLNRTVGEVK